MHKENFLQEALGSKPFYIKEWIKFWSQDERLQSIFFNFIGFIGTMEIMLL